MDKCQTKRVTYREVVDSLRHLRETLEDELGKEVFLHLSPQEGKLYEKPMNGWHNITRRFPVTISDIEECSKCFALARYPASVFHSMQIVEHGLIALGVFLEIKDPKSGWTAVCNELKRISAIGYVKLSAGEKKHFAFLEQVYATTEALKNAWRNKIDHSHNRLILLSGDFNPEIADSILVASKTFMLRLAMELPSGTLTT